MVDFSDIVTLLNDRYPGGFSFERGKLHIADGLYIKSTEVDGYAFVQIPPWDDQSYLLEVFIHDHDPNPGVWTANGAEEVLRLIRPWAFPRPWSLPEPIDPRKEEKRLRKLSRGLSSRIEIPCQFHTRKASLMLTGDKDGSNPRFVIEATGSNARLYDTAWKRPLAVDFLRYNVPIPGDE